MLTWDWSSTAPDSSIWLEATGMMKKVCWVRSSSGLVLFLGMHFSPSWSFFVNLSLKSCTFYSNFPAASWSSLLKCTWIQNQVFRWSFWGNFSSILLLQSNKVWDVQQSMPARWVYDKHRNSQSLLLQNISQRVSPCWKTEFFYQ